MHVIDEGIVYASHPKTDAASVCFAWVCALESGRWLTGFRLAPAKSSRFGRAVVSWSDDQGATWSEPIEPFKPAKYNGQPGVWRSIALTALGGQRVLATVAWEDCINPFLPMFNEETQGLVDMKLFTAISEDGGQTFGTLRKVNCRRYANVPTPTTGPTLVLPDGQWAAPFEVNKHYLEPEPWIHASAMVFSSNEGRTWGHAVDIHSDAERKVYCWDQRAAVLQDGTVLDLFWTLDNVANVYLNIHARASTGGGARGSWSELWDTGVPGQPARPVSLSDGRLVMVYVDRLGAPTIKARLSTDGGRTFDAGTQLLVHERVQCTQSWQKDTMEDAWAEMAAFSIGLPDAVALPDNTVLATFYSGEHPDATDLRWARFEV